MLQNVANMLFFEVLLPNPSVSTIQVFVKKIAPLEGTDFSQWNTIDPAKCEQKTVLLQSEFGENIKAHGELSMGNHFPWGIMDNQLEKICLTVNKNL